MLLIIRWHSYFFAMDGFVVVNKPLGMTSFGVIREARKKLNFRKIGHLGTLDPQAGGVLVLAIGQGTKLVEFFMKADKEYIGTYYLGAQSNTYDSEGEITHQDCEPIDREVIDAAITAFIGEISQTPPKYSAVKIKGQRACDIVRRGGDVEIQPKKVTIFDYDILEYSWPELRVRIRCSSGTYVRSLAHDLGEKLGCGAYLSALQRTMLGRFSLEGAVSLDDLSPDHVRELSDMVAQWPRWDMPEFVYGRLRSGMSITPPAGFQKFQLIAGFCGGELVGVLEWVRNASQLKFKKQIVHE